MNKSAKKPSAVTVTASAEVLATNVAQAVRTGLDFEATKNKLASLVSQIMEQYEWLRAHGVVFDVGGKKNCPHRQTVKESVAAYRLETMAEPIQELCLTWMQAGCPALTDKEKEDYPKEFVSEVTQQGKIVSAFITCYKDGLAYSINPSQAKKREAAKKGAKQPGNKGSSSDTTEPQEGENVDPTKTAENPHGLSPEQLDAFKAFEALDKALRKLNQYSQCDALRDQMATMAWFPKVPFGKVK